MNRFYPVALVLLLVSTGVSAQSLDERLEAARAAARVEIALAEEPSLRPFRIQVEARDGTFILSGRVASQEQRIRAEQIAENSGIAERIINRIELDSPTGRPPIASPPAPPSTPTLDTVSAPVPTAAEAVYHTVRSGETLFAIARRYNITVAEIQRLNNMSTTTIRTGQRLRVR